MGQAESGRFLSGAAEDNQFQNKSLRDTRRPHPGHLARWSRYYHQPADGTGSGNFPNSATLPHTCKRSTLSPKVSPEKKSSGKKDFICNSARAIAKFRVRIVRL